jgi:transposase-like protein
MMSERGLNLSHTTIMRWGHEFGPEIDKRIRPFLKPTNVLSAIELINKLFGLTA